MVQEPTVGSDKSLGWGHKDGGPGRRRGLGSRDLGGGRSRRKLKGVSMDGE